MSNTVASARSTGRALSQMSLALLPAVPARGPTRAGDVTADFLTEHVGRTIRGARAERVEALDGTTGTTDRRRLRVEWNDAGVAGGLPCTVFVKSTALSAKNRAMVGALDMAVNEVKFYRQVAPALGAIAPKAWFTYAGPGARHLLVLEDLVAAGARPFAIADDCPLGHAEAMMDTLARLHATFWESPRVGGDLAWARRWSDRPGYAVLKTFYRRGRAGAMKLDRPDITPTVRRLSAALDRNADLLYREFERGPLTLLHGDSHFGNSYALADGRAGLLDWQVIWQGPALREVAYFVVGALEPDVRRAHERALIDRYLEGLRAHGVTDAPSNVEAFDRYRLFVAEGWDACAMTISWPGLQAEENVEAGWRRACAAIEDLDTAALLERLG